jgi:hypothetical protein
MMVSGNLFGFKNEARRAQHGLLISEYEVPKPDSAPDSVVGLSRKVLNKYVVSQGLFFA